MTETDDTQIHNVRWREILTPKHLPKILIFSLALWLHAANATLVATTLPSAVEEIGGLHLVSWAFSLYLIGAIVAAAATSLVIAIFGTRNALMLAVSIYGIGSAICAMAPIMELLLVGRFILGLGGGGLMALVYVSQSRIFPNDFIPKLVAYFSVIWSMATFCGPLIGGAFATIGLWRFAFWCFFIQAGVLLVAAFFLFSPRAPIEPIAKEKPPWERLCYLALAILSISLAGTYFHILRSSILILVGCAFIACFLARDKHTHQSRMFPIETTDLSHTIVNGIAMTFLLSISIMSLLVYGPFILIKLYDLTPLLAGLVLGLESITWGLAAIIFAGIARQREPLLIKLGSLIVVLGLALLAVFLPVGPLWWAVICSMVGSVGFGMMWGFVVRRIVDAATAAEKDRASSLIPTTQQLGFAIGAALAGLIANGFGIDETTNNQTLKVATFWLFAGFLPIALFGLLFAWRFVRKQPI